MLTSYTVGDRWKTVTYLKPQTKCKKKKKRKETILFCVEYKHINNNNHNHNAAYNQKCHLGDTGVFQWAYFALWGHGWVSRSAVSGGRRAGARGRVGGGCAGRGLKMIGVIIAQRISDLTWQTGSFTSPTVSKYLGAAVSWTWPPSVSLLNSNLRPFPIFHCNVIIDFTCDVSGWPELDRL